MKFIDQKEIFDINIPEWQETFTYNFVNTYEVMPIIMFEWLGKNLLSQELSIDWVKLYMKDDAWYTGKGFVILNKDENTLDLKIYRYISRKRNFLKQDYDILGFKKERLFNNWELATVNYWAEYDDENGYSDLVVRENIVYNRDEYGYIQTRDKNITWINEDDTDWHTINTVKKYSMKEAAKAGEQARANILSDMKIATVGLIAQTEQVDITAAEQLGMPFIMWITMQIDLFLQWVRQPIVDAITNDTTYTRLDNDIGGITIRQYLIAWFSW